MGREGKGRKGRGRQGGEGKAREGRGGEGTGREGRAPPQYFIAPPSFSFLEICLTQTDCSQRITFVVGENQRRVGA